MAYFPNATAGIVLDEQCVECSVADDAPCPILWVQTSYNYDQFDDKGESTLLSEAMNCLVDEKGQCKMKVIIDNYLKEK